MARNAHGVVEVPIYYTLARAKERIEEVTGEKWEWREETRIWFVDHSVLFDGVECLWNL